MLMSSIETADPSPKIRIRTVSRERDLEVLHWLELRSLNVSLHEIAWRYNTSYQNVQCTLKAVDKDSLLYRC